MKKSVLCSKCHSQITISGSHGMKEVAQPLTCPTCGETNEVMWPMDQGWTVEQPKKEMIDFIKPDPASQGLNCIIEVVLQKLGREAQAFT